MNAPNINHLWANLIVEELVRNGITYFCIAPGSRSTPLTVAVARHGSAQSRIHFDERGLAFHALGYVSATKKPAVLICTSGTAVANFFPAIIECSKKKLPLIVLTADRPPELRQTGAVQTIDQVKIFGEYVKQFTDLPCPDPAIKPEFVLTTIDQAVYRATRNPAGPVHINCMFRDPLSPVDTGADFKPYLSSLKAWVKSAQPWTAYEKAVVSGVSNPKAVAGRLNKIKSGIIAVGKLSGRADEEAVIKLAQRLNWPVFADATSGLRLANTEEHVIHYFDQILSSDAWIKSVKVDGVLHCGGRLTSQRYYQFIDAVNPAEYVMILNHPLRNDPQHRVTCRVESPVQTAANAILPLLDGRKSNPHLKVLQKLNRLAGQMIQAWTVSHTQCSEPAVARLISQEIKEGQGLFLASSMPIREIDMFADGAGNRPVISGNRGASGIDGLVATAAGFAAGLDRPTTLFVGDLALLHDLNSLALLREAKQPLVIVVLNNNGGAIFSFLPIAQFKDVFETCFGTPHQFRFEHAAAMFGLNYEQPKTGGEFAEVYAKALKSKRSTLIEVVTDREVNVRQHKELQKQIQDKILKTIS